LVCCIALAIVLILFGETIYFTWENMNFPGIFFSIFLFFILCVLGWIIVDVKKNR
jgi:hypothetical protein